MERQVEIDRHHCFLELSEGPRSDVAGAWFEPTASAASLWGPMQHGGPVMGLLTHAMQRHRPRDNTRFGFLTVNLLGPVPLAPVAVEAQVERSGRKIELLSARMSAVGPDGQMRVVAEASGWRFETNDTALVDRRAYPAMPSWEEAISDEQAPMIAQDLRTGFVQALDWRLMSDLRLPGPSQVWMRMKGDLVAGTHTAPVVEVATIADVANGVGSRLDPSEWTFLNTEVSLHLFAPPRGGWLGMSAESSIGPDGIGMSSGVLYDESGAIGRVTQILLVRPR